MDNIVEVLLPKLNHFNKALVLASSKMLLYFMEYFKKDQKFV